MHFLGNVLGIGAFSMMAVTIACISGSSPSNNLAQRATEMKNFNFEKHEDNTELSLQCTRNLDKAREIFAAILSVKGVRTEANTLALYNDLEIELDKTSAIASLMSETHPNQAVRDDAEKCEQEVQKLATDLSLNQELFRAFLDIKMDNLDAAAKRLTEKTILDFKRSGVDKDDATRAKIKDIEEELVLIGQEFSRNIREDVRSIEVGPESLGGLPKDYVDSHAASKNGKIRITTDYPDYVPFMTYAEDGKARRELWFQYNNRGYPKNVEVLNSMIKKRHDLAQLLGYPSYADYVVEDKMIKKSSSVAEFIEEITQIAKPIADREYQLLLSEKQITQKDAQVVEAFERAYLEERYKKRTFDFDSQTVRPYFQFEKVREGLLSLTSELFQIQYKRIENASLWHKSVEAYDVMDGDILMGRIYLDLHPRENKYKHAAQFTVQSGVQDRQIPEGALVCNFADPSVSKPALMDHDQVVTFFHEFGHLLHHILGGKQKWVKFSGVATEWDFVEAPSQFFEEWAWDTKVLQKFAHHYETMEPISAELVEKMRAADEFGKGIDTRQQMFYAAMSLQYYLRNPNDFDALLLLKDLQAKYSKFPYVEDTHFNLNFGHLEGYSAMYYTYMWSKVIAKDLLSPFKEKGLMDETTAIKYRKTILEAGGVKDASAIVEDFLSRPYNFDAYRNWLQSAS